MAKAIVPPPEQGQLVSVRSRNWIVNAVVPSTLPEDRLHGFSNGQNLLTLSSIEDDGLGEELRVVWELEPGCRIIENVECRNNKSLSNAKQNGGHIYKDWIRLFCKSMHLTQSESIQEYHRRTQ
jgi:hypothetical protein